MRVFELADLREGMVVGRDVIDRLGRRLIAAGVTLTDRHLKAFRTWGIASVEVVTDDAEPAAVVDDARRQAVAAELAPLFRRVDRGHPVMAALFDACVTRRARFTATDERRTVFSVAPDWDAAWGDAGATATAAITRDGTGAAWVRTLGTLPTLPDVYYHLSEVLDQPRSSARDIANVIEDDMALAARVLRLVNSSFYGFPGRIDAIPQALAIIGTEEIKNLALATSMFGLFRASTAGYVTMRAFWGHSIGCGVAARVIAAQRRDATLDSMFICGLLHDIGALTLCVHQGARYMRALSVAMRESIALSQAERHVLGYDHAEVGEALLEAWNLPLRVRKTVAHCEDPQRAPSGSTEAAMVHVANLVTVAMQLGSSGEVLVPPLAPQAWEALRLEPEVLPLIIAEVDRAYNDVAREILKDDTR